MIDLAKSMLTDLLQQEGVKQIEQDDDAFDRIKAFPSAILLAGTEKLNEMRRKAKRWKDPATGKMMVRTQKYERSLPLEVNVFHKDETSANAILTGLLRRMPKGMYDADNNWIRITSSGIDWPPGQKGRALGVLVVTFTGGIYQDKELATFREVEILEVDPKGGSSDGE